MEMFDFSRKEEGHVVRGNPLISEASFSWMQNMKSARRNETNVTIAMNCTGALTAIEGIEGAHSNSSVTNTEIYL